MTNIYIYCLFDNFGSNPFCGVYSSIKAAHRDALKMSNKGTSQVIVTYNSEAIEPTLSNIRNIFKGNCDVEVKYRTGSSNISLLKTKLRE